MHTSDIEYSFFATTSKGLELLLVDELKQLGAKNVAEKLAGVSFTGTLYHAYQACLWSRLANRILLILTKLPVVTADDLYHAVQQVAWDKHFSCHETFALHAVTVQSEMSHSLFIVQKAKDAVVDQFRNRYGERPNVAKYQPDLPIFLYLYRNELSITLDLSGESLHKRGYRLDAGKAPLKENIAAAILLRAGWPEIARQGGCLFDPMCGSGTLLIEAMMMAANVAPGLNREYFGMLKWKCHDKTLWGKCVEEARLASRLSDKNLPIIVGYDQDPYMIKTAFANIDRANCLGKIHVEKQALLEFKPQSKQKQGLIVVNPPYGIRLGEVESLKQLYTDLGSQLKQNWQGFKAAVFTGNPELGKVMGLRAKKQYALFNGPLPCKLLLFDVLPEYFIDRSREADNRRLIQAAKRSTQASLAHDALTMFVNRLKKNIKHKSKQAKRQALVDYDVYDADLPDYPFRIQIKQSSVLIFEYQAPKQIAVDKVERRRFEVLSVLPEILSVLPENIHFSIIDRK